MKINTAEFKISSARLDQCPAIMIPEYAFIGRSNVGKSSLINMLTGRSALAKTSSTPGKTLLINHFIINDEWFLVDLPGYGFAKRSKKEREECAYISVAVHAFHILSNRIRCIGNTDKFSHAILAHLFCPHCVGKSST